MAIDIGEALAVVTPPCAQEAGIPDRRFNAMGMMVTREPSEGLRLASRRRGVYQHPRRRAQQNGLVRQGEPDDRARRNLGSRRG
jgi:hypothetical protein